MRVWPMAAVFMVLAAGGALFIAVLLGGVMRSRDAAFPLEAPGVINFTLDKAGAYTIFVEYARTQDSQDVARPDGIERLEVAVTGAASGKAIALTPVAEGDVYAIRRQLREPRYTFRIKEPGDFRLEASYPPEEPGPPLRLLLSRSYKGQVFSAFRNGLAVLLVTGLIVSGLLYWGRIAEPAASDSV